MGDNNNENQSSSGSGGFGDLVNQAESFIGGSGGGKNEQKQGGGQQENNQGGGGGFGDKIKDAALDQAVNQSEFCLFLTLVTARLGGRGVGEREWEGEGRESSGGDGRCKSVC